MKEYTNYIFDLYDTLVHIHTDETKPALWRNTAAFLKRRGVCWQPQMLRIAYLRLCHEADDALRKELNTDLPEIELLDVFRTLIAHPMKPHSLSDEQIDALAGELALYFRKTSREYLYPYPGTLETLAKLRARGKRLYLLSNAQSCFTNQELSDCGLANVFDEIRLSSDYHVRKPAPKFMADLLAYHHLNREETVMVGNDFTSDIRIAQSCGLESIFLNTYQYSPEEMDAQIRTQGLDPSTITLLVSGEISEILNY
ncbi:MAG: HAD family hydrolase [Lachnospiraceae bacterium]|nr:HAD family hydrolase [Lachnospiraceae bacterium]